MIHIPHYYLLSSDYDDDEDGDNTVIRRRARESTTPFNFPTQVSWVFPASFYVYP